MIGNWRRAFFWAVLWGAVGFFVPWVVELFLYPMRYGVRGLSSYYQRMAWEELTTDFYWGPALIFAELFGLAALAAYLPSKGLHFGRSLIVVIGMTFIPTIAVADQGWSGMNNSLGYAKTLRNCQITVVITGVVGFIIALSMGTERPGRIDCEETE